MEIDIKNVCRTCLQQSNNLIPLDAPLSEVLNRACPDLQPIDIVNRYDESSLFICKFCSESICSTVKFQKMALESEKTIRAILDKELFENTIKTEAAGEVSQDALVDKIETTLDSSFTESNAMITEDFGTMTSEISGTESETRDEGNGKTSDHNCESCSKSFRSRNKLNSHVKSTHQRAMSKCMRRSDDNDTSEDEASKIFNCDLCPKKFKKPSLLSRHVKSHDRLRHECLLCQKRFPSQNALLRHSVLHSELAQRSKINRPESQKFSCVVCGQTFNSPEELSSHHVKSHREKPTENKEPQWTCKLCLDVFPCRADIIRHSRNHIENATHQCALCNKLFVIGDELIDHFLRHKGMKPHQCSLCEKSFLKLHKLNLHLRTHSEDKLNSFLCPECGKSLSTNENLKRHLIRHSGIKNYACLLCPSRFVFKSGLTSHMSTHSGLKPFICDICGSSFTKSSSLTKHHRIHTGERPFPCEVCGMRFNSSDHVKRHFRTHTGERPYKCNYCDRSYAQSNDLLKHTRSHIGENTYKCNLCSAAFRLQAQLREHYSKEHYSRA